MPNLITYLVVDRVDLVEEGANSAAFIELYKRKEPMTMTVQEILDQMEPEHASVLKAKIDAGEATEQKLVDATARLDTVTKELNEAEQKVPCECDGEAGEDGVCKACNRKKMEVVKASSSEDESDVLKGMPESARLYVEQLKIKKEAAEAEIRKANEAKIEAEAVAKAVELKSLPVEQKALVSMLKTASKEVIDVLVAANSAINATVLGETGQTASTSNYTAKSAEENWSKIEAEADKLVKSADGAITKAKAIAQVIKDKPELYREYLNGGIE